MLVTSKKIEFLYYIWHEKSYSFTYRIWVSSKVVSRDKGMMLAGETRLPNTWEFANEKEIDEDKT